MNKQEYFIVKFANLDQGLVYKMFDTEKNAKDFILEIHKEKSITNIRLYKAVEVGLKIETSIKLVDNISYEW